MSDHPGRRRAGASTSGEPGARARAHGVSSSLISLWIVLLFSAVSTGAALADPAPAPDDLTEGSAWMWAAEANGGNAAVFDDVDRHVEGISSIRYETDGCFDTRLWSPPARDAHWDLTGSYGIRFRAYAENPNLGFQEFSPRVVVYSSEGDFLEMRPTYDVLQDAVGQWVEITVPWSGDPVWRRSVTGSPDFSDVHCIEIHADTWDCGFTVWFDSLTFDIGPRSAWSMNGRDMWHTGRAEYAVPDERLDDSFFDVFAWQKPSPDSPGDGGFSAGSMVFFDGVGPAGCGVVAGGYHWPKGVQAMDRHTGRLLWNGNPAGGETIGDVTPAFSNDGRTIYVVNDATDTPEFPNGHPLMAFATATGPGAFRHNGDNEYPNHLEMDSPTIAPDGRIFLHGWMDRPYAAADLGTSLAETWAAGTPAECGHSDPTLYDDGGLLKVVIGSRGGAVICYDGGTGDELWNVPAAGMIDASVTIDPGNGAIFAPAGSGSIYVVGLDMNGDPLPFWPDVATLVYEYTEGVNNPQRAQSAGCLSFDGATYYFQTNSEQGDGRLYAIDTTDGSVRWSFETQSTGWEFRCSSPIVTLNGVIVVGNNDGDTYFALRDDGDHATVLDTFTVDPDGSARATAAVSTDGRLYLPLRTSWLAGNGDDEAPDLTVQNLYSSFDLSPGATAQLPNPAGLKAIALNASVRLEWRAYTPLGPFDHFAVYRDTAPFTSISGMTPIDTVTDPGATSFFDGSAVNGTSYYYAVTAVTTSGAEYPNVNSVGPRTPYDETDLQIACIARTPRYPRYDVQYTYYEVTEPSGFGPYGFSAATGLGSGQDENTQRGPDLGDPVTYTATVRNRSTNDWSGALSGTWRVDGAPAASPSRSLSLAPGDTAQFAFVRAWDGALHDIEFAIAPGDSRSENDTLSVGTKSVAFLSFIDLSRMEEFREETAQYPLGATGDFIDWLNRHMTRFNRMFAEAGSDKRVHFDVLDVIGDDEPDPAVNSIEFAIFPFRYRTGEGSLRLSGYYDPAEDLDFGLLHEMGHQLGLIDIYQLDLGADRNQVTQTGYTAVDCLMRGCSPFLSEHSAHAMTHWLDVAHGYFGQYLYEMPEQVTMKFTGLDGFPLSSATVTGYQMVERPGAGKVISTQVKFQGTTNALGEFPLPNVAIDTTLVPTTFAGDKLHPNPFGYVAVVGTNGLLLMKIEHAGFTDYAWLDITEVNNAYWSGQTGTAVIERDVLLGGEVQILPPADMAELNASSWAVHADGASMAAVDDPAFKQVGDASVRLETNGGYDTYARYPGDRLALWNLTESVVLRMWCYAENPNGFQELSPAIRLRSGGGYIQLRPNREVLDDAIGQWVEITIPLAGDETWTRTVVGDAAIANVNGLEIHADTWGYGFTLWIDGVTFDPRPVTGIEEAPPARLALAPASPNPFTGATTFAFELPKPGRLSLEVFDVSGRLVRTLVDGPRPAGRYRETWDGRDGAGREAASGVYYCRIRAAGGTKVCATVRIR